MVHKASMSSGQLSALELLQNAQAMRAQRLAQQDSSTPSTQGIGQDFGQALTQNLQSGTSNAAPRPTNNGMDATTVQLTTPSASTSSNVASTNTTSPTMSPRSAVASGYAHLQPLISEVSNIAQNAGFVGIQPQEIVKAYYSGQSFLADYHV